MVTDLADIAAVRAAFTEALWEGFVFNQIVRNSDAHGKNWSFFVRARGPHPDAAYDLVNVAVMQDLYPRSSTRRLRWPWGMSSWEAVRPADWVASATTAASSLWQLAAIMERMAGASARRSRTSRTCSSSPHPPGGSRLPSGRGGFGGGGAPQDGCSARWRGAAI